MKLNVRRQPNQTPDVQVLEILGPLDKVSTQRAITRERFDLPGDWSEAVMHAVAALPKTFETEGRTDLTHLPFVTVDGQDAKDFDDAVYVETSADGWRVWVAIADVSTYVVPGTALDDEARARGTSVYFPGQVIAMLPERLSNDLCSLVPNQVRPVLVARMDLDAQAHVVETTFMRASIRSHARMTYDALEAMRLGQAQAPDWWQASFEAWGKCMCH